MKLLFSHYLLTIAFVLSSSCSRPVNEIWLDELDLSLMKTGRLAPRASQSVQETPLSIGGEKFQRGIGTTTISSFLIDLNGRGKTFSAKVGLDDVSGNNRSVNFYVLGDQKILWESGVMKKGDSARSVSVNLKNVNKLGLLVTEGDSNIRGNHADWADAKIEYSGISPSVLPNKVLEEEVILTPPSPQEPRINGPKIYGVRPGSPFLYRIPVTGERPVTFEVSGLPQGLQIDSTGIITGSISSPGTYHTVLIAKNSKGESRRPFTIECGNELALTPPMGWNSWYIHYNRVSDSIMRLSADLMVSSGMADFGYQYVNIDDCWMVKPDSDDPLIGGQARDKNGNILSNKMFPDMKGLTEYIHSKGLKAGIYISPGPLTCQNYEGSYLHESTDARTFAEWGFDFLKYDWCSYRRIVQGTTVEDYKAPYKLMWNELQKLNRDIVFNLCQYGLGEVWKWGGEVGHCWRTTGDLGLAPAHSMPGYFSIGMSNARHWEYARPGEWNDPDYILIGWVGSAWQKGTGKKTDLTPNEQYSYMSMWALMAAPLVFSGDMAKLDPFTLNVLCNNEVIDINQDVLGQQARILKYEDNELIMVKDLEDGSKAVGLFNITGEITSAADYFIWETSIEPRTMSINSEELGISGKFKVRDVWRQEELGIFENTFEVKVPHHGVMLLKVQN